MSIACMRASSASAPDRSFLLACAVAGILVAGTAAADWTGKGEVGAAVTSGNTDTKAANAKVEIINALDQWKHMFGLAANYVADDIGTTGQRWEARGQSDYSFTPRSFWYGALRYEDDRFSGFDYQSALTTGLGHRFIDTDVTKLVGQVGVGYKFVETRDSFTPGGALIPGDTENSVVFTAGVDFSHQLTDTTQVLNRFLAEAASDNTFLQNELALQVRMSDVLALAVGYAIRYNTDPPAGFEKTDTLTTLNLVYEIK